jgi:hypothetical protein
MKFYLRARPVKGVSVDDEWKPENNENEKMAIPSELKRSARIAKPGYKNKYVPRRSHVW